MFSIDIPLIFANDAPMTFAQQNNSADNISGKGNIFEVTKSTRKKHQYLHFLVICIIARLESHKMKRKLKVFLLAIFSRLQLETLPNYLEQKRWLD